MVGSGGLAEGLCPPIAGSPLPLVGFHCSWGFTSQSQILLGGGSSNGSAASRRPIRKLFLLKLKEFSEGFSDSEIPDPRQAGGLGAGCWVCERPGPLPGTACPLKHHHHQPGVSPEPRAGSSPCGRAL